MCECCCEQVPDRTGSHIARPVPVESLLAEGCLLIARPFTGNGTLALFIPLPKHRRRKAAPLTPSVPSDEKAGSAARHLPFPWASFNKDTCYDFQA